MRTIERYVQGFGGEKRIDPARTMPPSVQGYLTQRNERCTAFGMRTADKAIEGGDIERQWPRQATRKHCKVITDRWCVGHSERMKDETLRRKRRSDLAARSLSGPLESWLWYAAFRSRC